MMVEAHDAIIAANSDSYEWLAGRAQRRRRRDTEALLRDVAFAAMFAGNYHPGRFADGAIENLVHEAGIGVADRTAGRSALSGRAQRLLHVASHVLGVGGHTRMLRHWIERDRSVQHSLVVLHQGDRPVPQWLVQAVADSGGALFVLKESPLLAKALHLRDLARRLAERVILHCDGCDVVPCVAFAVDDVPPVILLDHADHVFWLGSTVADHVINFRTAASALTAQRRFATSSSILPIPVRDEAGLVTRRDARKRLGIGDDEVVLLSVGRGEKFRPCGRYDFVATAHAILERHHHARFFVVGESHDGIRPYLRSPLHPRLHLAGSVEQPLLYRAAADVYLESFPFGSQTALLEAGLAGLPVVPAYAPLFPLLVTNDDSLEGLVCNPVSEAAYREEVSALIDDAGLRSERGQRLRQRLLEDHVGDGWLGRLAALHRLSDRLTHRPRPLPVAPCRFTADDVGLGRYRVMADGANGHAGREDAVKDALRHAAYVAKFVGNYPAARRHAWAALKQDPGSRASWRLLTASLLGKPGRWARQALMSA